MNTKLTLRLEENLIRAAKRHAGTLGKSVSQMVADYFYLLDTHSMDKKQPLTPIVASLRGSLKGSGVDEKTDKKYLEDKYL
jgi:hypothetical protein